MKKILFLEDEKDVATATIDALGDYDFVYVDNLIDFHDYIIHEKNSFKAFFLDLQLDLGSSLPILAYKEEIPDVDFDNPTMLEYTPLYGWDYYEYILLNNQFVNIKNKFILITGHFEWLKDNGYLKKHPTIKIVKKRGDGALEELISLLKQI